MGGAKRSTVLHRQLNTGTPDRQAARRKKATPDMCRTQVLPTAVGAARVLPKDIFRFSYQNLVVWLLSHRRLYLLHETLLTLCDRKVCNAIAMNTVAAV